jgi:hypothetical protein
MRTKKTFKRICIEKEIYDAIIKERDRMNELYDIGKFSISDIIRAWKEK